MTQKKTNFNNVITLVPQVLRFGYKLFKAWKSDGIDEAEAKDLIEELFTILIFTIEEFDFKLPEEDEDPSEEVLEEPEGEYIDDEEEEPEEPVRAVSKAFKNLRGKKK